MIKACVIGWPIAHSRSPLIHGYWLERYGIAGRYDKCPVAPGELDGFLRGMRARGLAGCNVTLPHKRAAFLAAARAMPAARAVAAANTLWFEAGELVADNTDAAGFLAHLSAAVPGYAPSAAPVAVLGAGGAACAIVHALLMSGVFEVRVFNRTRARADDLATHFGERVRAYDWGERVRRAAGVGLLINATSLGMLGCPALEMDVGSLPAEAIVADIVYVPLITPLMAAAAARGLRTVDGLGMLMHQAAPGFEKWFGVRPEVTHELRALLVRDLEAA